MGSERDVDDDRRSRRSPSRRWLLPAIVVLGCATLLGPQASQLLTHDQDHPVTGTIQSGPSGLDVALSAVFDPGVCLTPEIASQKVRELLDARGLSDWTIKSVVTTDTQCVTWSLANLSDVPRTVALIPVSSPEVHRALEEMREDTYTRCMSKDQVVDLLRTRLAALGQADVDVRDDGPLQVPLDRQQQILAHVKAGCWVYSTNGWINGRATLFISGDVPFGGEP